MNILLHKCHRHISLSKIKQSLSKRAFQITHHDYSVLSCKNCVGNIRSHNGDVNEKVAEKKTLHPVKVFRRHPKTPCYLKEGNLGWTGKKGDCAKVQTDMVEFIALPFPFSIKLKTWSFYIVVVQAQQRNLQKRVLHVQSCCFARLTDCFFDVPVAS